MRLIALLSLVFAQTVKREDFFITNPYSVTAWKVGSKVTVEWETSSDLSSTEFIIVDLMYGPSLNANAIVNIATDVPTSSRSVSFTVPATLGSSKSYFVRITGKSNPPMYGHSARFEVQGKPGVSPPSVPTAPPPGSATSEKCPTCATDLAKAKAEESSGVKLVESMILLFLTWLF